MWSFIWCHVVFLKPYVGVYVFLNTKNVIGVTTKMSGSVVFFDPPEEAGNKKQMKPACFE